MTQNLMGVISKLTELPNALHPLHAQVAEATEVVATEVVVVTEEAVVVAAMVVDVAEVVVIAATTVTKSDFIAITLL
jgi:hypothetical protein